MDTSNVLSLLEQLDDEIDDLEEALSPLVTVPLSESASKLPLLDRAKLYVLVTYAIESILFSYLRLNGVKAREHPVFTELTRVKQYFEKIKVAESPVTNTKGENLKLDKGAALRIIKAGLSGNDRHDLQLAEKQAKERAKAHIKFGDLSERMKQGEISKKRKTEEKDDEEDSDSSDSDSDAESSAKDTKESPVAPEPQKQKHKSDLFKREKGSASTSAVSSASEKSKERKHKEKKKKKKSKTSDQ